MSAEYKLLFDGAGRPASSLTASSPSPSSRRRQAVARAARGLGRPRRPGQLVRRRRAVHGGAQARPGRGEGRRRQLRAAHRRSDRGLRQRPPRDAGAEHGHRRGARLQRAPQLDRRARVVRCRQEGLRHRDAGLRPVPGDRDEEGRGHSGPAGETAPEQRRRNTHMQMLGSPARRNDLVCAVVPGACAGASIGIFHSTPVFTEEPPSSSCSAPSATSRRSTSSSTRSARATWSPRR